MNIVQRFLSLDHPIGPALVRVSYYLGATFILLFTGYAAVTALIAIMGGNFGQGATQLIAAPAVGAAVFVVWRVFCEVCLFAYKSYERLEEIRAQLPDYSQF